MIKARAGRGRPSRWARRSSTASSRSSTRRDLAARPRSTTSAARRCAWRSTSASAGKELTEVKRGRGGIRDVEFAVQLLQIVHGRRDARSARRTPCAALARAGGGGLRGRRPTPTALADAYRFLRRLEHRLQIVRDLQTHDLPADPRARTTLARSLGLPDADALAARVRPHDRARCARSTSGSSTGRCWRRSRGPRAASRRATAPPPRSCSTGWGSREPARAYDVLARLVDPATRLGQGAGARVPGHGAGAGARGGSRRRARAPGARRRRRRATGRGPADAAGRPTPPRPAGSRTWPAPARSPPTCWCADPERIRALADARSIDADDAAADARAARWRATRRASSTPRETGDAIAESPTACVRDAVDDGGAGPRRFAVIGLGKLGARELNFASDLDVVFVYEGEGADDQRAAVEAAERVMRRDPRRRLGARRRPAAGGPQRAARAVDRRLPRVLGALRRAVGVPGAAAGPRASPATPASAGASSSTRPTWPTRPTASRSTGSPRSAGCASGSSANA